MQTNRCLAACIACFVLLAATSATAQAPNFEGRPQPDVNARTTPEAAPREGFAPQQYEPPRRSASPAQAEPAPEAYYLGGDGHFSPAGNARIALEIERRILAARRDPQ